MKLLLRIIVSLVIVAGIVCILLAGQAKGEEPLTTVYEDGSVLFYDFDSTITWSSDYCFGEYLFIEAPNKNNVYSKVKIKDDCIDRTYVEDGWFIIELNEEKIK